MTRTRNRTDIDRSHKWNPETVFSDEEAFEHAVEQVTARLDELRTKEVATDGETLAQTLDTYFDLWTEFERVNVYVSVRTAIDATDDRAQELSGRASDLESRLRTARSVIEARIQRIDPNRIGDLLAESEALAEYDHYLRDLLRQAEHTAEPAVEEALSTLAPAIGGNDIYETLRSADLSFPSIEQPDGDLAELTLNSRRTLLRSSDRSFRRTVHERFYDVHDEYRHTIAATFDKHVQAAVRKAEVRGYDSSLAATLDDENVPVDAYETLTETVRNDLGPLHEHLERKRERLDVETLRPWDVGVRLIDDDPTIPYEKAKELVLEAVSPLGEPYQSRLARGLESGWVDVYESPNKASGAGTIPAYSTQPFVLLNWQSDVNSLFGLAHEVGHAMHAALTSESQPMVYGWFDMFISEVPSTLTETLLVRHVLDTTDDPTLRRAVLDMWLERFRDLLYRRARYAICERRMHEHVADGDRLTAERLDRYIIDGWNEFNAPIELDDWIAGEWMHASYLNMFTPFYVYQYATGFSAALALAGDIREEWEESSSGPGDAAEQYLHFLRQGSSAHPIDLLADAGVDLTSATPIERAIDAYRNTLATTNDPI
jgi:oligoendopeptidase F